MNSPRAPQCPKANVSCRVPRKCQAQLTSFHPRILVVEDGSGLLTTVGAMLESRGFDVILAPDARTARNEKYNGDIVAVIAGATRDQAAGLELLAAVKANWAGVKTLVVTRLDGPDLPVQAYELELDDYLHWPLTGAELTGRVKGLFKSELFDNFDSPGRAGEEPGEAQTLAEIGSLVDRFTDSLAMISQSLAELRQEYREAMAGPLSEELFTIAARVQMLSDSLRQCWHFQAEEPQSHFQSHRFH